MKRYHPILVVIHWVMLVLIVMAWTSGQFVLEHTPNSDPGKIDALRMHMTVGLIAGALLILRLVTKLRSEQPPHAKTGSALLDKAGVWGRNPIPIGDWACGCSTISSILAKGGAIFARVVWQTALILRWSPQNAG